MFSPSPAGDNDDDNDDDACLLLLSPTRRNEEIAGHDKDRIDISGRRERRKN